MSLSAYQRARTLAETPRSTEARLLRQVTGEMIAARDAGLTGVPLTPSLFRNREVWNAFADDCATKGNRLPTELRASIVSLGLWVDRFTSDVAAGRETLEPLIEVNRSVIEGLEGMPTAAAA